MPSQEERNRFNKIRGNSEIQTIVTNPLKDHGFEYGTGDWDLWPGSDAGYSDEASKRGEYSMKMETPDANTLCQVGQEFNGEPGETYTLSADVCIPEALEGSGGASLGFGWVDSSQVLATEISQPMQATSGWERVSFTCTLPADAGQMFIGLAVTGAEGVAYFDNVQLEKSGGARYYNLVENSDFSDAVGTSAVAWDMINNSPYGEGVQVRGGRNYMILHGSPSLEKCVTQNVMVNAQAGETLIIGGKATAFPVIRPADVYSFGILAELYDETEALFETIYIPFDHTASYYRYGLYSYTVSEHQVAATSYTLEQPCSYMTYSFIYYNQANQASFDSAFVYIGNFGTNYEYEGEGRVEVVSNGIGDCVVLTYDEITNDIVMIEQVQGGIPISTMEMEYDSNHNVTCLTDQTGVETSYTYDTYGQTASQTIANDSLETTESMTYTSDGNYLETHTDARGGETSYTYDLVKGLCLSATDPNGNTITYDYDPLTDELVSTAGQADLSTPVSTDITTQNELLKTITRGGQTYSYEYNGQNQVTAAKVGTKTLVSNTYDSRQRLANQTFANGAIYTPLYDSRDRLAGEQWNGVQTAAYYYNENDRLSQMVDHTTGVTEKYEYGPGGRIARIDGSDGMRTLFGYDEYGFPTRLTASKNGATIFDAEYTSNDRNLPSDVSLFTMGAGLTYDYDDLNRLTQRSLSAAGATLNTSLEYLAANGNTTDLVSQFTNEDTVAGILQQYDYEYDANGNITSITDLENNITTYTYDGLNRLTSESDGATTLEYDYDANGNLTSVTQGLDTWLYTYNTGSWKDQLTSFNGKNIVYDGVGNPLFHDGKTFSWQRGRQLAGITGEEENISYQYNAAGLRTSKTVNGVTTNYLYSGDMLMRQQTGEDVLDFAYDANRKIVGFNRNGVPYYYLRNLQGDVVAIVDTDGAIVAQYEYDAWGNSTVLEAPNLNPDPAQDPEAFWLPRILRALGLSAPEIDAVAQELLGVCNRDGLQTYIEDVCTQHNVTPYMSISDYFDWYFPQLSTALQAGYMWDCPYSVQELEDMILQHPSYNLSFDILSISFYMYFAELESGLRDTLISVLGLNPANAHDLNKLDTMTQGVMQFYLLNIVSEDGDMSQLLAKLEVPADPKPFVSIDIRTSLQLRRVLLEMINLGLSGGEIDALASGIVALDMMDLEPMWSLCEAMEWDAQEVETLLQGMKGPYVLEPTAELINFIFTLALASPQELEEGGPMYVHFAGVLDSLSQFIDGLGLGLPDLELDLGSPATELAVYILVYEFVFSFLDANGIQVLMEVFGLEPEVEPEEEPLGVAYDPELAELNPIRYRGYYWDYETGYYFLQTRYYNPQWRRFLNADSRFVAGDLLVGSNMYAYW